MSKAFSGSYYTNLPYIDEINVKRKFYPLYSRITKKKEENTIF